MQQNMEEEQISISLQANSHIANQSTSSEDVNQLNDRIPDLNAPVHELEGQGQDVGQEQNPEVADEQNVEEQQ